MGLQNEAPRSTSKKMIIPFGVIKTSLKQKSGRTPVWAAFFNSWTMLSTPSLKKTCYFHQILNNPPDSHPKHEIEADDDGDGVIMPA
ncbi:unnamed protein product [Protopolystoma xenopodis]|uniref:Uncharacterized protein n=1 Tax=Protopolystoma xenopodis TaxID=117903 RepID=A0A448WJI3_9PLAT|nr:unnamed protein product [Protopolystoma xenopodis]